MRVQLLTTGSELLRGRRVDAHLPWIADLLGKHGIEIGYHATVGDDFPRLVEELKLAGARSDVCIVTGGLGPTEDDWTRRAVEEAFHRPLVYDAGLWRAIRARFARYRIPVAPNNRRQAFRPKGAATVPNPLGSAPGFRLSVGSFRLFCLPGPPREMRTMFLRSVLPILLRRGIRRPQVWEGRAVGLPEGDVDRIVQGIVGARASYGLTVHRGVVTISVRGEGSRPRNAIRDLSARIRDALGIHYLETSLEEDVVRRLRRSGRTIAVAESCTGGRIADRLTNVPGVSAVLREAVVAYSDASKIGRLDVPEELIRRYGAVSAEVASAMAEGVRIRSGADVGVGTTGIAGPAGGTSRKPVGLVYAAVAIDGRTRVVRRLIPGDRREIKDRASYLALYLVRLAFMERRGRDVRKAVDLRRKRPRRGRSSRAGT